MPFPTLHSPLATLHSTLEVVCRRWSGEPRVGVILGTGMGPLASMVRTEASFDFTELPGFGRSTALGHCGKLLCGTIEGTPTVVMQGRLHCYEGYNATTVTLPVRLMHALGIQTLIATNACGGLSPNYATGDVMAMEDHINFMGNFAFYNGERESIRPTRAVDSTQLYDAVLIERAIAIGRKNNFAVHRGVYVAMSGPNYETRAEYRMLRKIGADVVGMSTIPETMTAAACGLKMLGLSIVTNLCRPDAPRHTSADEVLYDASLAAPQVETIVRGVIETTISPAA